MIERLKTIVATHKNTITYTILAAILLLGVILRFYIMTKGHNFDFESYKIVGDIVTHWGNVYAETTRYNYGPVWFTILGLFREIGTFFVNSDLVFRILIVGLLTVVDVAIALILFKKYGVIAFAIFFLNPISIVITGYHNQFDNLAILIGLLGLLVMPKPGAQSVTKRHMYSALLIGLSLMTKHIFFVLPLWLFIREKNIIVKLFMTITPLILFAIGFVPFLITGGADGILQNVFLYKSFANAPLLNALVSQGVLVLINPTILLIAALIFIGFMTRKLPAFEAGLWYLITLVCFSPAIANQYLAIVMPAVVGLGFIFFLPYVILAGLLLIITSGDGVYAERYMYLIPDRIAPYITPDAGSGQYKLIIASLFVGAVLLAVYRYRRSWYVSIAVAVSGAVSEQVESIKKR